MDKNRKDELQPKKQRKFTIDDDRPKPRVCNDSCLDFGSYLSYRKANESLRILFGTSQSLQVFSTASKLTFQLFSKLNKCL